MLYLPVAPKSVVKLMEKMSSFKVFIFLLLNKTYLKQIYINIYAVGLRLPSNEKLYIKTYSFMFRKLVP